MKKEKNKLSSKQIEEKKYKRKKTIAKVLNVIIWIYAIGISFLLVIGSCGRTYSSARAESEISQGEVYNPNDIFTYQSKYNENVIYRFYLEDKVLNEIGKSQSVVSTNKLTFPTYNDITSNYYANDIDYSWLDIQNDAFVNLSILPSYYEDLSSFDTKYPDLKFTYGGRTNYMYGVNFYLTSNLFKLSYRYFYYENDTYVYKTFSHFLIGFIHEDTYGGYSNINLFNSFRYLVSGNFIIDTSFHLDSTYDSKLRVLALSLVSQYAVHDIDYDWSTNYKTNITYDYSNSKWSCYGVDLLRFDDVRAYYNYDWVSHILYKNNYVFDNQNYFSHVSSYVISCIDGDVDYLDIPLEFGIYNVGGSVYHSINARFVSISLVSYYDNSGWQLIYPNLNNQFSNGYYGVNNDAYEYGLHYYVLDSICLTNSTNNSQDMFLANFITSIYNENLGVQLATINITINNVNFNARYVSFTFADVDIGYRLSTFIKRDNKFIFYFVGNDVITGINDGTQIEDSFITTFSLINMAMGGILSLFSISILPGLSLGVIFMAPVILTLILVVVKLFKR